ncbi:MAG: glycosyltransferase family 2 protein [Armatimonadota bacterium]
MSSTQAGVETAAEKLAAEPSPRQPASVSVIVPVYNECDNLRPLHQELVASLEGLGREWEIMLVDDGSTDGSQRVLAELQQEDERTKVVLLRRNFGQTAAMAAGFDHAGGDVLLTMDGDLQNDPADIPRLLAKFDEGFDVVSGWRRHRKDNWLTRRLPSAVANWLISRVTGVALHDYGCTLKAYDREVVDSLNLYGDLHRFIPALASWAGARMAELPVNHRPRRAGRSKYGLSRTFRVLLDLLVVKFLLSYSTKPIQIFGLWGALFGLLGFALAVYLSYVKLVLHRDIGDRPLLLLAVLLIITGIQFVTMGLLAELQARTYHEAQSKPVYVVRKVLGRRG